MLPILSDAALRRCVMALAPDLADPLVRRIRLRPAAAPGRGDLSTDAALLAASGGRPAGELAGRLAARLAGLDGVGSAHAAGSGFVNLSFTDAALDRILREAPRGAPGAAPVPRPTPPELTRLDDPAFAVQYAHARCRSVLRAAASLPGMGPPHPQALDAAASGWVHPAATRALLCRIEHWSRLAVAPRDDPKRFHRDISLFLHDFARHFDRVWMASADDATLRLLHPGQRSRTLANVALVLAAAEVIRSGLSLLGIAAAEEIR